MKVFMSTLVFAVLFFCDTAHTQELVTINKPGQNKVETRNKIVLGENIFGPCQISFSSMSPGNSVPVLSRAEKDASKNNIGSFDKLATSFSGKIYSAEIEEPFIFKNISPFEFIQMKANVYPMFLERPYTLYLDLKVQVRSHSVGNKLSDDAGEYKTVIAVTVSKL